MVLHEILLSLLCTIAASEYLHGSRWRAFWAAIAALSVNTLLLLPAVVGPLIQPVLALQSKVPLVALCFLVALHADTVLCRQQLSHAEFLMEVAAAVIRLLPLFSFLAIAIAFVFLEIGEACERLGLKTRWLDNPIYYGVLHGPFGYVYVSVRGIAKARTVLPMTLRSI